MNKMIKQMALVGFLCFSVNAAKINVAAGASIGAAIKSAVAKDTIFIASDTFVENNIVIDKQLTIIGVHKDSTIIKRKANDSVAEPTVKIQAKNVAIMNVSVFGHDGYRWGVDTAVADLAKSYPATDAMLINNAESTWVYSCNLSGGKGVDWRSLKAASGGVALRVYKSKWTFLEKDSIQGGNNDRTGTIDYDTTVGDTGQQVINPIFVTGLPGPSLYIDSSSYLRAKNIYVMGGEGNGINYKGFAQGAAFGVFCVTAESVSISNSILYGGRSNLGGWDTFSVAAVRLTAGSSVKLVGNIYSYRKYSTEDEKVSTVDFQDTYAIFSYSNRFDSKNSFTIRYGNGGMQSLVVGCVLKKASIVAFDLLNAKGQAIKRIRTERSEAGMHRFAVDLKSNGSLLANAAYFLRVATNESSQSFKLPAVR